jgi:hypothetical protein
LSFADFFALQKGLTALLISSGCGYVEAVAALLEHKANINAVGKVRI